MIWNIPIEPLEERYSSQWSRWFEKLFSGKDSVNVTGLETHGKIRTGSFLDIVETQRWKNGQVIFLAERIKEVRAGDVFFFHDLWHPGIISLAYMLDCLGLRKSVKIVGCLHAGTYDPWDFLSQSGCGKWGCNFENAVFNIADSIFVATHFHLKMLVEKRYAAIGKIVLTGFPMFNEVGGVDYDAKEKDLIVFPHRLNVEKQPEKFDILSRNIKAKFVKTKEVCKTKAEYYELLKKSSISVSFALQETWGIAMIESVYAGAIPLVPDALSYSELYPEIFRYKDSFELEKTIRQILSDKRVREFYKNEVRKLASRFEKDSENAMGRILNEIQK